MSTVRRRPLYATEHYVADYSSSLICRYQDRRAESATDSTVSKYVAASMDNTPDLHHPTVLEGGAYQGESREWLLIRVVGAELAVMGAAFVGVALVCHFREYV